MPLVGFIEYVGAMEIFNTLIGVPLGYLMYWCYLLLQNYGAAILLFTLFTKVILFPLSVIAQKNSIKMVKMQPELTDIRQRNAGNGELIAQETRTLYKKERYSTWKGLLPLLIQIPIILGLIGVIYNPLQHLFHFDAASIKLLVDQASVVLQMSMSDMGFGAQLFALEAVKSYPAAFASFPELATHVQSMLAFDSRFLGFDLSDVPSLTSLTVMVPIASGLSALALSLFQNKYNVLQIEQGFIGKWGMAIFLVVFSGYFAAVLPCGLGLYWTAGNLLSIPVLALCNLIYSPKKYIDYAHRIIPVKKTREQRAQERVQKRALAKREQADSKRFYARDLKKNLVVYSESSGFWKYLSAFVNHVIEHSDFVVHYVTSDPNDRIFETDNPQIVPYYIGPKALIAFMMKMDADIVLMTTPDLELFHVKRSLVRKDIEYIYLDHGMTSFQLAHRKGAFDYFDTIFVYGPNHIAEIRETEKLYRRPPKTLVKTGYGLLDELLARVEAMGLDQAPEKANKQILIAPSWQANNLLDLCVDDILKGLLGQGYRLVVRPHPEYVKRFPARMNALIDRYAEQSATTDALGGTLTFETDFSSNETVYHSDLVITDWSTIAQEFSYATKKPSLFINTPMKVLNPEWDRLPLVPLDISLRDELGVSIDTDKLSTISDVVADLLNRSDEYREHITSILEQNIYDIGKGARSGGDYLIARIREIEYLRSAGKDPAQYAPPAQLKAFCQLNNQIPKLA